QMDNDAYAWCWALAKFLDAHPRYRDRFRAMKLHVTDPDFDAQLERAYRDDWQNLLIEWQAFIAALDYGYDFERMAIDLKRGQPLDRGETQATIAADCGWQSSGVWLEAGQRYRVSASGRYQIATEPTEDGTQPWPCEPGGVTIDYRDGYPLGM